MKLTSFNGPFLGAPCWSPDGQRLAFTSIAENQFKVFVISASGGKPRRLTTDPAGEEPSSWSRDGRWIYVGSNRGGDYQVWKMPTQGGRAVQVTRKGGFRALESPDGKVLYYAKSGGPTTSLWKVPVEGGEENQVLASLSDDSTFAVVDEGIYFIPTPDPTAGYSIQFFSFATRKMTLITKIGRPFLGLSVSPDRKWILYSQLDERSSDLMLVENFR